MKLLVTTQAVDKYDPILGFFIVCLLEFAKHFERIDVICLRAGTYELPPHVHVHSLGKEEGENRLKYLYRFYKYFFYVFFIVRVDYVFYHMGAIYNILGAPFFLIRRLRGTKFYWWKAHGHINLIGRMSLSFVDIVCTSTDTGFPIQTPKKRIVGQAISTERFSMGFDEAHQRNNIIFVGRITPVKKIDKFLHIAQLLQNEGMAVQFNIIGPIEDQDYKKFLDSLVIELNLERNIDFLGPRTQDEIAQIFRNSMILLNTSATRSMDKTVLEAILSGCVPVTGNEAFEDLLSSENLYVKDDSVSSYVSVIQRVYKSDDCSALRMRLREKVAEQHALTTFTSRVFV